MGINNNSNNHNINNNLSRKINMYNILTDLNNNKFNTYTKLDDNNNSNNFKR